MADEYASITRQLHIDASPEVVFEVLSSPQHIRTWWSAETEVEPVVGADGSLTWTDEASGRTKSTAYTVVDVDAPRRFSFRWTHPAGETAVSGNSLLVTFELVPTAAGTTVSFRETGFRERGWEVAVLEAEYNDHRQGWDFYLSRAVELAGRLATTR